MRSTSPATGSFHGQASKKNQLVAHMESLMSQNLEPTLLDKRLIKASRKQLLKVPPSQRIYSQVRTTPKYAQRVDLNNLFGDVLDNGFATKSEMALRLPVLFTKDGYDDVDLEPDSPVIAAILQDSWVLGEKANTDYRKEDLKDIAREVNEYYLKEYSSRWRTALGAIKVAEFNSLQQGVDMLSVFADPVYSPIVNILKTTSNHTSLTMHAMLGVPGENSDKSLIKSSAGLVAGK